MLSLVLCLGIDPLIGVCSFFLFQYFKGGSQDEQYSVRSRKHYFY